jgi:ferredoxin--NADP+ reductase
MTIMTERIEQIANLIKTSEVHEVTEGITLAENLKNLSTEEKKDLAEVLSDIFYFHDYSGISPMAKLAIRAEQIIAGLDCEVVPFLISELVFADSESAAYFGKAIAFNPCSDIQVILDAWNEYEDDHFAVLNLIQTLSYYRTADTLKAFPQLLVATKSDNFQLRGMSVYTLGKLMERKKKEDFSPELQLQLYDSIYERISDSKPIVRQQAAHALGQMQHKRLLTDPQRIQVLAAFNAILGRDNRHKWDRAFIVRNEAEKFLPFFSGTQKLGDRYRQSFKILKKRELCVDTYHFVIEAPLIAKKLKAGQFLIVRPHDHSERIPLSVCGWDKEKGTVELIVNTVGKTSGEINGMGVGSCLTDIVGPLGERSHVQKYKNTCVVIGGGYGTGAIIPTARDLKKLGNKVIGIVGARNKDLLLMTDELADVCDEVMITTNDGSRGIKGFVTDALKQIMDREKVSSTLAIGPVPMMNAVSEMTRPDGIETFVSLNAIMVDGTGMCGACRVSVGGKTKFACFHGPDFNGHEVDFEQLTKRQKMFVDKEKEALAAI